MGADDRGWQADTEPVARRTGTRVGLLGAIGAFLPDADGYVFRDVPRGRRQGAINLVLWVAGFLTIGLVGRRVFGGSPQWWIIGAIVIMAVVALLWPWSIANQRRRSSGDRYDDMLRRPDSS